MRLSWPKELAKQLSVPGSSSSRMVGVHEADCFSVLDEVFRCVYSLRIRLGGADARVEPNPRTEKRGDVAVWHGAQSTAAYAASGTARARLSACARRATAPVPSAISAAVPRSSRSARGSPSGPFASRATATGGAPCSAAAVEREFGFLKHHLGLLKHHFGLAAIRVRGIERVRLHADLIMLARLASALSRARAVSLTA